MNEQQYMAYIEHHVAFLKAEIAHVNRELSELEDYKSGKRRSNQPLGSKFFVNAGTRLMGLLMTMERMSGGHSDS